MPFGDPRPLRRKGRLGLGRKATTESPRPSERQSNPLKVGLTIADAIEMCPRIVNPLEVVTGARLHRPDLPEVAVIDVLNREDGQLYQILVTRKPQPGTTTPESRS